MQKLFSCPWYRVRYEYLATSVLVVAIDEVLAFCTCKHSRNLLSTHPNPTLPKQIGDFADGQCATAISVKVVEHSIDVTIGLDLGIGSRILLTTRLRIPSLKPLFVLHLLQQVFALVALGNLLGL